jgi:hypothetical protein
VWYKQVPYQLHFLSTVFVRLSYHTSFKVFLSHRVQFKQLQYDTLPPSTPKITVDRHLKCSLDNDVWAIKPSAWTRSRFWWPTHKKKIKFQAKLLHILLSDFMQLYLKFSGLTAGIWQWHKKLTQCTLFERRIICFLLKHSCSHSGANELNQREGGGGECCSCQPVSTEMANTAQAGYNTYFFLTKGKSQN